MPAEASAAHRSAVPPLLSVRGVSKAYPGVQALAGVDLDVRAGEVHALTGENGSGKSTLAKVIGGVIRPDSGTVLVDGAPVHFSGPADALRSGIVTISQELTLAPTLTVAENIHLGRLPRRRGRIDWPTMRAQARRALEELEVHVSETDRVDGLSVELQQEVEIARALSTDSRLIILDEATSSLSEAATERLLRIIAERSARGVAVLMISHRMPELYATASKATVLRDGHLMGDVPLPETPERDLIRLMVGRELTDYFGTRQGEASDVALEVRDLRSDDGLLKPTSLSVRRGEVLGVAGLVGSGKSELGMALGGAIPAQGEVTVSGHRVRLSDPRRTLAGGIGYVPDDRKRSALLPVRSVAENFVVAWLSGLCRFGVLNTSRESKEVRAAIDRYGVVTASPTTRIQNLSGGNQQKVVLGRMFALDCDVYVLSEPTRGVDVGSKSAIYALLREIAGRGAAVVLISSELPELIGMSDRVVVFFEGEIRGEFSGDGMTEADIAHVAVAGDATAGATA
ncbi:sugar ABC transporter ATP-binding protein [Blastococcus sp. BMG 814]|uniref:Sugar ABC transporter ATP-binding protein n=1 Tax=Blastococcus carthaginiensis TaxID=3050034 RepID=A0ABT9IAB4_9ACTN|nr:sugar ABC transporter ATP-binding protein [Blastococcus carthaginiensis]MDP5182511.1 sugar ABC transporter ATP-binding protein [Blastococcus carthaginiensis]